ncbi:MAG: FkbM family methyltransferase [Phycisphaerae bacterium]|nr:FkbM family methyltransferase [Phycisphaerae bacterium]
MRRLLRPLLERAMQSPRFRGMVAGMLGRHLQELDLDFLRAIPDGLTVDLDRQLEQERRDPGLPSVFWSILWEASAARALGDSARKDVHFTLRGKRFSMELDLAESPECGYLLRNPTVRLTRLLAGFEGRGRTMLDVGANVGFHTLTAGLFFRRVVAFEPTPATAERLERNVMSSALRHIDVKRCALSNRRGEAAFTVDRGHCGANRLDGPTPHGGETIRVPLMTLDELARSSPGGLGRIDFIKIDVEGHECEVLEGGLETIRHDRPQLFVEFNTPDQFDRFRSLLPEGYRSVRPDANGSLQPIADGRTAVEARDVLFLV